MIVDPEKGPIVQKEFDLYLSGVGVRRIAKQFIEEGVPAIGTSGRWQAPYLYQVIKSPKVIGTLTNMDGADIEGFYPAVVDKKIDNLLSVLDWNLKQDTDTSNTFNSLFEFE